MKLIKGNDSTEMQTDLLPEMILFALCVAHKRKVYAKLEATRVLVFCFGSASIYNNTLLNWHT